MVTAFKSLIMSELCTSSRIEMYFWIKWILSNQCILFSFVIIQILLKKLKIFNFYYFVFSIHPCLLKTLTADKLVFVIIFKIDQ